MSCLHDFPDKVQHGLLLNKKLENKKRQKVHDWCLGRPLTTQPRTTALVTSEPGMLVPSRHALYTTQLFI